MTLAERNTTQGGVLPVDEELLGDSGASTGATQALGICHRKELQNESE